MKKLLTLALIVMAFCRCAEDDALSVDVSHNVKDSKVTFNATSATADNVVETLEIISNSPWTISLSETKTDVEWITVAPLSGVAGTHLITLTAKENKTNEERQALFTLLAGDVSQVITLTQVQNNVLGLDVTELNFTNEGGRDSVLLSKNLDYEVFIPDDVDWLEQVITKSVVEDKLVFAAKPNSSGESRYTKVTITAGELTQIITVTQAQNNVLGLDVTELDFTNKGGRDSVVLSKNLDYTVFIPESVDWLEQVVTKAVVEDKLIFVAKPNLAGKARYTKVTITAGKLTQTIDVTQEQTNVLGLDITKLNFKDIGGLEFVTLSQNLEYNVSIPEDAGWLEQVLSKAVVEDKLTFTAKPNTSKDPRHTKVTITAGKLIQTIDVTQEELVYLTFQPISEEIDFRGGDYPFTITSNREWSVRSDKSWVSFDVEQGDGIEELEERVIATFERNTETIRSATIFITSNGKDSKFEITQQVLKDSDIRVPHIYIDVDGGAEVVLKEYYDAVVRIDGGDRYMDLEEVVTTIKGRGNSTWGWPKKPYKLKLDKKASILGLEAEKDWVLLANHIDPSLMVNAMAMKAGALFGVPFVNTMIPVDVTINGEYRGSYSLTEQVEVKKARVNLSDNGYLLELDEYFDDDPKYRSPILHLPVMVKGTELDLDIHFSAIKDEFTALEAILMADAFPNNGYEDLIDLESVAAFLLANDITMNFEITMPKSVFLYKDLGTKFGMGPIWDFDWTCGYAVGAGRFVTYDMNLLDKPGKGSDFFNQFLSDPEFVTIYKRIWNKFENSQKEEFFSYMNDYASILKVSADKNFAKWDLNARPFPEVVDKMEAWFRLRIAYLDEQINNM